MPVELAEYLPTGAAGRLLGVSAESVRAWARSGRLASREILGSESTEEFVRRMREVTPEDVQRVAQTYLDPERPLIVIVGPRPG